LTSIIYYYLIRWKHLNRITTFNEDRKGAPGPAGDFVDSPENLLEAVNTYTHTPLQDHEANL
jgi:hypothetical protein